MVVSASNNANTHSADEDDISVTLQSDFPTKTNAFARISIPKKSFLEQIRDAQAVGPLALDLPTNEYPLITGPENRKYKLRAHFYGKPRPSWIQQHSTLLLRLVPGNLNTQDGKLLPEEEAEFGAMLIDPVIRNLQLKADNDTRWHLVYYMIERALLLREPLTQFSARYNRLGDLCDEAILSSEDWAVLTEVKAILAPFKFITKKFEGRKPNLSDVVTHIFSLHRDLKHLHQEYAATFERSGGFDSSIFPPNNERPTGRLLAFLVPMAQERPQRIRRVPARFTDYEVDLPGIGRGRTVVAAGPQGPHIELGTPLHDNLEVTSYSGLQSSIKYAINKLEKYMEILDETPAYWAALILHPGRRMKWVRIFYRNEDSHRIQQIQRLFVSYFDEHYAITEVPSTQSQPC
ncbi:hypothetical protein V8F33_011648 [Rhypophila sp. PSN 637]